MSVSKWMAERRAASGQLRLDFSSKPVPAEPVLPQRPLQRMAAAVPLEVMALLGKVEVPYGG